MSTKGTITNFLNGWSGVRLWKDAVFRSLARNSGWAVAGEAVTSLALLAETFLLARMLSLDTFGTFIVIISIPEVVFGLLDFRSRDAVVKFVPELRNSDKEDAVSSFLRWVFTVDLSVSIIGLLILVLGAIFFKNLFPSVSRYAHLVVLVGLGSALAHSVRSVGAFLRVSDMFPLSVKLGMCASISRLILIVLAVVLSGELSALCMASAGYGVVFFSFMAGAAVVSFRRNGVHPWRSRARWVEWKSTLGFMISTNVSSTLKMISKKLDVIVIAALSSPSVVALYKVSARIASTVMLISDPLVLAVYPEFSQLHAEGQFSKLRQVVGFLTKAMTLGAGTFLIIFLGWGSWIIQALAGEKYVEAYPVAGIMLVGSTVAMAFFWTRPMVLTYGMATYLVPISLLAVFTQFSCLLVLMPTMGVQGAGVAFASYYFISMVSFLYILRMELFGGPKNREVGSR